MRKSLFSAIIVFLFCFCAINTVEARSGCCSHHGGVCGCGCCDGSPLSATCAPYYPSCNSNTDPEPVVPENTTMVDSNLSPVSNNITSEEKEVNGVPVTVNTNNIFNPEPSVPNAVVAPVGNIKVILPKPADKNIAVPTSCSDIVPKNQVQDTKTVDQKPPKGSDQEVLSIANQAATTSNSSAGTGGGTGMAIFTGLVILIIYAIKKKKKVKK
jgi:hypothetical protein